MGGSRWDRGQQQRRRPQQLLDSDEDDEENWGRYRQEVEPYDLPRPSVPGRLKKPAGSRVVVTRQGPRLEIDIPPAGLTGARSEHQTALAGAKAQTPI